MKNIILLLLVVSTSVYSSADALAPIGVMLDHTHPEGEGMVSYRLMKMGMKDISKGGDSISVDDYFANSSYMMAPKDMEVTMHMLGAMYALSDDFSLNVMASYIDKEMTMIKKMGRTEVESHNSGLGDTKVNAIYSFVDNNKRRLVGSLGMSIPTGSINEKNGGTLIAPSMQNGSGSYGLLATFTYSRFYNGYSFGSQLGIKTYLGDNSEDYKIGNQYDLSMWGSYAQSESISYSLRLNHHVQDVFDYETNNTMSSATDFRFMHGKSSTVGVGVNYLNTGKFAGHRLALEYDRRVYSNYTGYKLKIDDVLIVAWQKVF